MGKHRLPLAALVLAVLLAGCGAGRVTHITAAPTATGPGGFIATTTATTEPWMRDSAFLLALDKEGIPYGSDSGAIEMAHFICDDLRDHPERTSTDAALLVMRTSVLGAADSGFLVGAAVNVYCPEFNSR